MQYTKLNNMVSIHVEGNDRDAWGSRIGKNYDGEEIASTPLSGRKPRPLSRPAYPRPGGLSLENISS